MTNRRPRWLNSTTGGVALASFFSDVSHELATAVLPAMVTALGGGAAALGLIEGVADGSSALAKLWGGVMTDRLARRKGLAATGYLVTAVATAAIAACARWWQVALCRTVAWIGRGSRSPARDALLSDAATPETQGRAFGLERAGDAFGAVVGPLVAMAFLAWDFSPQRLMLVSLLPGTLAFLAVVALVRERPRSSRAASLHLRGELDGVGAPFRRYLAGILLFGSGDFSRTLLILYVLQRFDGSLLSLRGASAAVALYVIHNAVSAAAAIPIGALADRLGHRRVVVGGYLLAAATTAGFALGPSSAASLVVLFVASGLYIACEEVAEKSCAVSLLPKDRLGAGMGLLAATNAVGDLVSSALVGTLWSAGAPGLGFGAAALLQLAGALLLARPLRAPGGS